MSVKRIKLFPKEEYSKFQEKLDSVNNYLQQLTNAVLTNPKLNEADLDSKKLEFLFVKRPNCSVVYQNTHISTDSETKIVSYYFTPVVEFLGSKFFYKYSSKPRNNASQGKVTINVTRLAQVSPNDKNNTNNEQVSEPFSFKVDSNLPTFNSELKFSFWVSKGEPIDFNKLLIDTQEAVESLIATKAFETIGYIQEKSLKIAVNYFFEEDCLYALLKSYNLVLELLNACQTAIYDLNSKTYSETWLYRPEYQRNFVILTDPEDNVVNGVNCTLPVGSVVFVDTNRDNVYFFRNLVKFLEPKLEATLYLIDAFSFSSQENFEKLKKVLEEGLNIVRSLDKELNNVKIKSDVYPIIKIDEALSKNLVGAVAKFRETYTSSFDGVYKQSVWNYNSPIKMDFGPNEDMYDKVMEHCKDIPDFTITCLRKVNLLYKSDGCMRLTPHAINHPEYSDKVIKIVYDEYKVRDHVIVSRKELSTAYEPDILYEPVIYLGEAWLITFTAFQKDLLSGCRVYFATPEQFYRAYQDTRPDLLKDFTPFSDLMVITSDWCSRNNPSLTYDEGIDLYSPWSQRQSLKAWILGPAVSKNAYVFVHLEKPIIRNFNGYPNKKLIRRLERKLDKTLDKTLKE